MPVFPSKTFPSHYSIATGLYTIFSGIVDNHFEERNLPEVEKKGINSGERPNYFMRYDSRVSHTQRIDKFDICAISLITFSKLQIANVIVDRMINYLTRRLVDEDLVGCANIVILSDHAEEENYLAYKTEHMPIRYDYRGSPRIGDIIIEGRPGVLLRLENDVEWSKKRLGDHGYDNREPSVLAILGAFGPISTAEKWALYLLNSPTSKNQIEEFSKERCAIANVKWPLFRDSEHCRSACLVRGFTANNRA
uniref:Uncharacterized protein n=1 Tax=Parascaris equorum TaxID=6256 RepID=A0A914S4C2_PAREQ